MKKFNMETAVKRYNNIMSIKANCQLTAAFTGRKASTKEQGR